MELSRSVHAHLIIGLDRKDRVGNAIVDMEFRDAHVELHNPGDRQARNGTDIYFSIHAVNLFWADCLPACLLAT